MPHKVLFTVGRLRVRLLRTEILCDLLERHEFEYYPFSTVLVAHICSHHQFPQKRQVVGVLS